jgi:hypothetical protein
LGLIGAISRWKSEVIRAQCGRSLVASGPTRHQIDGWTEVVFHDDREDSRHVERVRHKEGDTSYIHLKPSLAFLGDFNYLLRIEEVQY